MKKNFLINLNCQYSLIYTVPTAYTHKHTYGHSHSSVCEMTFLLYILTKTFSIFIRPVQIPRAYFDHDRLLDFPFFFFKRHSTCYWAFTMSQMLSSLVGECLKAKLDTRYNKIRQIWSELSGGCGAKID